jgi:hypothetical protein
VVLRDTFSCELVKPLAQGCGWYTSVYQPRIKRGKSSLFYFYFFSNYIAAEYKGNFENKTCKDKLQHYS